MIWRPGWKPLAICLAGILEALAVEEFRLGRLTQPELRRLLGFATRQALDAFLKAHEVYIAYTEDDLDHDRSDLRRLGF